MDNFDLKKFLTENKLTTASRVNEGPADDLELKSLAKKMVPILKKYKMPVEYVTDEGEFKLVKKPKDAEKNISTMTVPARLMIKNGVLHIAVYYMSLAKSHRVDELDIDYSTDGGAMRRDAEKYAAEMYEELKKLIDSEKIFQMEFKSEMNQYGDYVMRVRKTPEAQG
jgi:hypothetical protein